MCLDDSWGNSILHPTCLKMFPLEFQSVTESAYRPQSCLLTTERRFFVSTMGLLNFTVLGIRRKGKRKVGHI